MQALLAEGRGHVFPATDKLEERVAMDFDPSRPIEVKLVYRQRVSMNLRTLFFLWDKLIGK